MYEKEIEILREDLEKGEAALDAALLAEYIRRRSFVDAALKDYLKNDANVEELNDNRFENYANLDKIRDRFCIFSIVLFLVAFFIEPISCALMILYVFLFAYFARSYYDIRSNDGMQLTNLVMCQFEKQRLLRGILVSGVDDGDVERYKHEMIALSGRAAAEMSDSVAERLQWIELRMAASVLNRLRNLA